MTKRALYLKIDRTNRDFLGAITHRKTNKHNKKFIEDLSLAMNGFWIARGISGPKSIGSVNALEFPYLQ